MRYADRVILLIAAMLASSMVFAQDPAISWDLDDALRQIDRQADDFDTAMASVYVVRTDRDGVEQDRMEGVAFINEDGDLRISASVPETRVYLMDNRDLYIYLPDQQIVQEYYLPKHPQRLIPFVRLGFSETGRDLRDDYLVSAIGERFIGDRRTLGLDLTPKSDKERARLKRVIKVQRRTAGLAEAIDRLRSRITDVGVRGGELRENLKALAKTRGAAKLKKKLLKRIADNVARMEKLTQNLTQKTLEHGKTRDRLKALIRKLSIGKKD